MDLEDGGEVDDLRGDIELALNDAGGEDPPGSLQPDEPEVDTKVDTSPALDGEPRAAPTRDSMGRFLPKTAQTAVPGPQAAPGTPDPTQDPNGQPAAIQAPAIAPPAGWTVTAREQWDNLPPAVQQEVVRREQQMQQYVSQSAPARQLGENFWSAVQPHMQAIQAEGVDPLTAVHNLLQFGNRMRMGTSAEKARTIAQVVKAYDVPIEDLDNALVGNPVAERPQDQQIVVQNAVQQALAPLYQAAQQRRQAIQQQAEQAHRSEIETFAADPQHQYFPHLRGMMADLVEVAQRQGSKLSLEDAYQRAAMLHPEISKAMIAQRQGVNAHQLTAAAQRARAAAVSVNGSAPIGNPNVAEPTSIRESIEAAIEAHSRY